MNAVEFSRLLCDLRACPEAQFWAKGKTLARVWETCERGDWLLWLCAKMIGKSDWPTHQEVVLAACDCAETALKYLKSDEDRPRIAIETARRWAIGKATIEETSAAAADAAAAAADAAAAAAVRRRRRRRRRRLRRRRRRRLRRRRLRRRRRRLRRRRRRRLRRRCRRLRRAQEGPQKLR